MVKGDVTKEDLRERRQRETRQARSSTSEGIPVPGAEQTVPGTEQRFDIIEKSIQ
jgi:hypothetical protein